MPLLPVGIAAARMHARLWADLSEEGGVIGAHDLWLAAACLTYDLRLATGNVREFGRVPALVVEDWSGSARADVPLRHPVAPDTMRTFTDASNAGVVDRYRDLRSW